MTSPIGAMVRTPTGRIGVVTKHRGAASKLEHFQRVVVAFGPRGRDTLALQPHLLRPVPGPAQRVGAAHRE